MFYVSFENNVCTLIKQQQIFCWSLFQPHFSTIFHLVATSQHPLQDLHTPNRIICNACSVISVLKIQSFIYLLQNGEEQSVVLTLHEVVQHSVQNGVGFRL